MVARVSCGSMSADSDRKSISVLITKFVQKVDFGRDFEQHLNFLVDARRAFSRMEVVQVCCFPYFDTLCAFWTRHTQLQIRLLMMVAMIQSCSHCC